jgi:hypothetical protein
LKRPTDAAISVPKKLKLGKEARVHKPLVFAAALLMGAAIPCLKAQNAPPTQAPSSQSSSSKIPDLSGSWLRQNGIQSISNSDIGGKLRGKEPDIPYQPWALTKTMSERPPTGPDNQFESTTDPWILYCEPPGLVRVYMEPGRTKFVQTPDAVYILHEVMQSFRIVRLNSKHPDDPDPSWWGDSIGWYENGDTLVIDTIGTNGRTWLDQLGHPTTEKLHLVERYKRVDANTLDFTAIIDDPGAYTKPFISHRIFTQTSVPFLRDSWVCSVRENQGFFQDLYAPATNPSK